eukprot:CAMPEP_0116561450 /NCGR_PEP_ID=MMETSP0397-20121206/11590_1 /TAXON_ID=216820 /ORGANISM="Cyclophora tenuis, Strain ECT3854" /LENGTH=78 /DNA_ID=CAMNT_0004087595 /DNA_START=262 /DNA_END=496 /DNA_ORIENTATION=-
MKMNLCFWSLKFRLKPKCDGAAALSDVQVIPPLEPRRCPSSVVLPKKPIKIRPDHSSAVVPAINLVKVELNLELIGAA